VRELIYNQQSMEATAENFPAAVQFYKGNERQQTKDKSECKGHFLFFFVRSGLVKYSIDGTKVSCTSNELMIALCRKHYHVLRCSGDSAFYVVKVQWQFITDIKMSSKFIDLLVSRHILKILPDEFDSKVLNRIMKLLHYYYESARNPDRFSFSSFNAALSLLVFQAAWLQDSELARKGVTYTRKELLAMQFLKLLVQHYREESTAEYYARRLCITSGYLNRAVREVTGRTVNRCISEIIISEAKYLLLRTELTVETISEQLHFSSAGSFSRFFKKEASLSPTQYRKDNSE